MPTKKPVRRIPNSNKAASTLMANQDLQHKGDSTTSRKKGKCITFWVTDSQKNEISTYATEHNTTISRLIIEGLELRMNQE